ncbi:PREDICTED: dual specificity phosphatase 28 [Thamnophis sirtalis]|uniref:Dual specificity phosphatase 28 n=1 Tax=Thamnophis sirtalis TaxID=35019 RepID=A0A6I9X8F5_9SAUR|nr:PREDICTED: dual specificity phosphatase 28 [Thamnophis sirtalis]
MAKEQGIQTIYPHATFESPLFPVLFSFFPRNLQQHFSCCDIVIHHQMLSLCKIADSLFISNSRSACCESLLSQERITFCINVSRQQPFPSFQQSHLLRIPVFDDPSENLYKYFEHCSDAIEDTIQRGGKCLVYCKNGRSRSATICTAYLMKHQKLRLKEAFEIVKIARPMAEPNVGFWSQLQKYEDHLQRQQQRRLSSKTISHNK